MPLTIYWVGLSLIFLILGSFNRLLGVLGASGIALSLLAAGASAASAPMSRERSGIIARFYLWIVNLAGPTIRSLARERVKWRFEPSATGADHGGPINFSGEVEFATPDSAEASSATILGAVREALVRHGVAVAETDGFQSYDLELVIPPLIRVPINALRRNDSSLALLWRIRPTWRRTLIGAAVIFVLMAAGFSLGAGIVGVVFAALAVGVLAFSRASRIPAIVRDCAAEAADALGTSIASKPDGEA